MAEVTITTYEGPDADVERLSGTITVSYGAPGQTGPAGPAGPSAYAVAVEAGFTGTEAEWLDSLQGVDGDDGIDGDQGQPGDPGASAYEVAVANGFVGTEAAWLESLVGAAGDDGTDGDDGAPGPGVAAGGTTGQILAKNSATDYDTAWIDAPEGAGSVAWDDVTGKPSTYPPATHTHDDRYYTETETDGLLGGKANASHAHATSDVTGLDTALAGKAAAADLTAHTGNTSNPHGVTKAQVGLGSVDNVAASALRDRSTHTGTQSADTVTDGTTNKAYTATEKTKLAGVATGATANDTDANLKARANHTGTQAISTVSGLQTALDGKVTATSTITKLHGPITQAAYDALTPAADTLYVVVG